MDPIECSKLLDELIRKHDKNGDGKFNFQGKYREQINAGTDQAMINRVHVCFQSL